MRDNTAWTVDGVGASPTETPFAYGTMHVVTLAVPSDKVGAFADEFAQDRVCRIGGMRYGEFIAFKEALTSMQLEVVRNYLLAKWKGVGVVEEDHGTVFNLLAVGAGASLTITDNIEIADGKALDIALPLASEPAITVNGTVTFGGNVNLDLAVKQGAKVRGGNAVLLSATEIAEGADLSAWTIGGTFFDHYKGSVSISGNDIVLTVRETGLVIMIR